MSAPDPAEIIVGYITGEDERGEYVYRCGEHTPEHLRESHRELSRREADDTEASCEVCGEGIAFMEPIA